MTDLDFLRRAGRILADRGPTARVGEIDILALDGRYVLWPDSAEDASDPAIQIIDGDLDAAIGRARAAQSGAGHSDGDMEIERAPSGDYRVLSHDSDDQGQFTEEVAVCYRLANARLIAAAPAVLEALREARSYVFHMTSELPSSRPWNALLLRLDAAIAKATGEA